MSRNNRKVVSTTIDDGHATLKCYSNPADGDQHITDTCVYDMRNIGTPTLLNLAAFGFIAVAGNRYQNNNAFPDVRNISEQLYNEMVRGDWQPGKRDAESNEPTDLMKAIAEATGKPVHLIQHQFETDMTTVNHKPQSLDPDAPLLTNRAGKTRRYFNAAVQRGLEADRDVAPILARIAQERARATLSSLKGNKQPSKLADLFQPPLDQPSQGEAA